MFCVISLIILCSYDIILWNTSPYYFVCSPSNMYSTTWSKFCSIDKAPRWYFSNNIASSDGLPGHNGTKVTEAKGNRRQSLEKAFSMEL
jgi:hypothetical protein